MSDYPHRVQLESVRWVEVFPGLRLLGALRRSLGPSRLFLALLLVVLLFLGGKALDFVWGDRVFDGELLQYTVQPHDAYADWLDAAHERETRTINVTGVGTRSPIFQTLLDHELMHFNRMVSNAVAFNFGLTEMLGGQRGGVVGEIQAMTVTLPGWLLTTHPGFSVVLLTYAFVLTVILGGAITRLAALEVCRGQSIGPFDALRFAVTRAGRLIAAPLLPLVVVAIAAALLALAGGVFFNLPLLDVIGALLFFLLLLLGALAAAALIGLAFASHLMTPAIAVEDADAFDAVSRSFSYALAHPWRYLAYLAVCLVYGAIGYMLVGLVLFLTLWATKTFASVLVFAHAAEDVTRLDAILPDPQLGVIHQEPQVHALNGPGKAAAMLVGVWVKLLLALLPAYCVSFYFTASTRIYLLLRHYTDGAAFDEVAVARAPAAAPDKVEPAAPPSTPDAD